LHLIHKVVEKAAVLNCGGVIQGGLDGHPLVVYHNCANHTLKYGSILVYHSFAIILVALLKADLMGTPSLFTTIVSITP
jgi:hypothetical protein